MFLQLALYCCLTEARLAAAGSTRELDLGTEGAGLVRVLPDEVALTRSFYLVRHVDDRRLDWLNRFAAALAESVRRELSSLEGLA